MLRVFSSVNVRGICSQLVRFGTTPIADMKKGPLGPFTTRLSAWGDVYVVGVSIA